MEEQSYRKRARVDSEDLGFDTPEVKRIRENLLDSFDDSEFCMASHELDLFMKSFEEEIASGTAGVEEAVTVVDLTSESGDSQPELGYLLEASDDELGLPPSASEGENVKEEEKTELVRVASDSSGLGGGEFWRFDADIPSFDSFEFGADAIGNFNNEYVALDGLFDYSDLGFGSTDFSWRPETLPAK